MDPLANLQFTTSGALIELVDKKVLVHLRDDRKLIGVLRSYDQYANLVLTQTIERLYHPPSKSYAQTDRGVFLVRGENVVLLGEVVRRRRRSGNVSSERDDARRALPPSLPPSLTHSLAKAMLDRTQDLDAEDEPLQKLTLVPWPSLAALLSSEKKRTEQVKAAREGVLFERQGFGEEGGEGDAY
ncbi:hypothetical protein JCM1841_005507 [Sporobolomyces salmonicolor]